MATLYPPVGFHFLVEFLFEKKGEEQERANDVLFQSVSGLNLQLQTDTLREGGENRFAHVLPVRNECTDLVLKRGLFNPKESQISKWCFDAFTNFVFAPVDILVKLLDEKQDPLITWNVHHAWPKNWKLADFNAEKGEIVIETFELRYNYYTQL